MARLRVWCADATAASRAEGGPDYRFAYVDQPGFERDPLQTFAALAASFTEYQEPVPSIDIKTELWKYVFMKTTLDLPDDLLRAVKVRAARSNRRLKDVVAELLEKGMNQPAARTPTPRGDPSCPDPVEISPETGLPIVRSPDDAPIARMNTEEIYALIHRTQEEEDIERLGRGFPSR